MKKIIFMLAFCLPNSMLFAQSTNDGLTELAKDYKQYMFRNAPPESILAGFDKYENTDLAFAAAFIKQTITRNNTVLTQRFLSRPADKDLKYIYIIKLMDNTQQVNDLMSRDISPYELLNSYYFMLFGAYGNMHPYDLSGTDFEMSKYNFKDDTERGIFFLTSMNFNSLEIWGFMHFSKPPNYAKALDFINLYPKYNGKPYYQYLDMSFPDFEVNIESETQKQSYKEFYINRYYDVLLTHLACLNNLGKSKDELSDLVLGSILKAKDYYKYSKRQGELDKLLVEYQK